MQSDPFRRAVASHQAGNLRQAQRLYQGVLRSTPDHAPALNLLGALELQLGNYTAAEKVLSKAARLTPQSDITHYNLGIVLRALRRLDDALECYDRALAINKNDAEIWNTRGSVLRDLKRFNEAIASFKRALAIKPNFLAALYNCANAYQALGLLDQALMTCDQALSIDPGFVEAWSNRGLILQKLGRGDEALRSFDNALEIDPRHVPALNGRGHLLYLLDRFDEAISCLDRALSADPSNPDTLSNRGAALQGLRRFDEAQASFDQALAVDANHANAHWNEALLRLALGDYPRGWMKYEWRWKKDDRQPAPRDFSQPIWDGTQPIRGKTILLHAEQGLGDTLQFSRYIPLVAQLGARIALEIPRPLKRLLSQFDGIASIVVTGEPLPPFDYHCPLMSLPLAFETEPATIPVAIPYLEIDKQVASSQQSRIPELPRLRVGLAWSGNPRQITNRRRSIALDRLAPLFSLTGVRFVSLQNEVPVADASFLQELPFFTHIGPDLGDFAEVAGVVAQLDLIITVDTSFAHLAGALGKPVWILLSYAPDWRWMYDREDSPWYPTARLFRQPVIDDWESVVDNVKRELATVAERHRP
jgi:tetratricopeptide (TPR) repeat protein